MPHGIQKFVCQFVEWGRPVGKPAPTFYAKPRCNLSLHVCLMQSHAHQNVYQCCCIESACGPPHVLTKNYNFDFPASSKVKREQDVEWSDAFSPETSALLKGLGDSPESLQLKASYLQSFNQLRRGLFVGKMTIRSHIHFHLNIGLLESPIAPWLIPFNTK